MVRGHNRARQGRGGTARALGVVLAALALALQAILPLADASWHARQGATRGGPILAMQPGATASPLKHPAQPASADAVCQLCIGLQAASGPVPTGVGVVVVPIAYRRAAPQHVTHRLPSAQPAFVPQPRAPPLQV
ncbi:MAG: hypothetical protein HY060_17890 [Proteobacteria bacterium]|nr:hypothetical protein [Pseudomonadota bacterium]